MLGHCLKNPTFVSILLHKCLKSQLLSQKPTFVSKAEKQKETAQNFPTVDSREILKPPGKIVCNSTQDLLNIPFSPIWKFISLSGSLTPVLNDFPSESPTVNGREILVRKSVGKTFPDRNFLTVDGREMSNVHSQ